MNPERLPTEVQVKSKHSDAGVSHSPGLVEPQEMEPVHREEDSILAR